MSWQTIEREWSAEKAAQARKLCADFLATDPSRRFVMGLNVYATAIGEQLEVAAFVDDFTTKESFAGRPIVRVADLPADAFVLAVSGGRPLTVRQLLRDKGIRNLDYFTFLRWSGLDLPQAVFNEDFQSHFDANTDKVSWLLDFLADETSRETLRKLFSFRYSYDLDHLEGFKERQTKQYFEPFQSLSDGNPVFVDVGGFDGFTTEEFIKRVPEYRSVFLFEPEQANLEKCKSRLASFDNIRLLPFGAGDRDATLRFSADGSASSIRDDGEVEIHIRRIDDVVTDHPTFIKMDIEGAEHLAIEGARNAISSCSPELAIAVYHRPADFWDIPQKILSINPSYRVFLRHYTESIYETVMYFCPN